MRLYRDEKEEEGETAQLYYIMTKKRRRRKRRRSHVYEKRTSINIRRTRHAEL